MTRRRWGLLILGIALAGWAMGGEWLSIRAHVNENHLLDAIGGLSFLLAGLVALDRRPGNLIGPLLIAFGFTWYLGNWSNLNVPLLPVLGVIGSQLAGAPILAHIALAFPTGRLQTRLDRVVLGLTYAVAAGASVVLLLTYAPRAAGCTSCAWEPAPFPSASAAPIRAAVLIDQRSAFVLVPLFLLVVWLRWRRATSAGRRDLAALWVAACMLALIYLMGAFASQDTSHPFGYLLWELQTLFNITIPILFLWGLLSTRLARSAVGDLVMELERPLRSGELRGLLARTLGDPTLGLLFARAGDEATGGHRWVDGDGRPGSLPEPGAGHQARAVTVVERDSTPLAALIHDPALEPGLVRAVAAAAGIRLENERLQADLRAQLDEVRASRQRIVEAGDQERRRVERNLHDGAQQRLVTLALSLAMLRDQARADPALAKSIDRTTTELKYAIAELRELARGIHPAILTEEGLPAAVEALADRSSVPVRVRADFDGRLAEPVETVAYFVVAESIANVIKYSSACAARIELSRSNGMLLVEIADDGVGGADAATGSGLRGLADRVAAVRGTFGVQSPAGGGTLVRAEIPCDG